MTRISKEPRIVACPDCNHYYQELTLLSFNDLGNYNYLDGYQSTVINSISPPIVQCKKCRVILERSTLKTIDINTVGESIRDGFDSLKEPSLDDSFSQLSESLKNETSARLYAMWRYNHPFRKGSSVNGNFKTHRLKYKIQAKANELRLIELLDNNDNERLIKADILRRNKRFNKAKRIVNSITDKSLCSICDLLYTLCSRKNTMMVTTDFDPDPHINKCIKSSWGTEGDFHESIGVPNGKRYLTLATSSQYSKRKVFILSSMLISLFFAINLLIP